MNDDTSMPEFDLTIAEARELIATSIDEDTEEYEYALYLIDQDDYQATAAR